jgi:hypothetical protein
MEIVMKKIFYYSVVKNNTSIAIIQISEQEGLSVPLYTET